MFKIITVREGKAEVFVPDPEYYVKTKGYYDPAWLPVFYNPRAELSRDLSVLLLRAYIKIHGLNRLNIVEPLSATGIRGIRYAKELDQACTVYMNDIDRRAYNLMLKNIAKNGVEDKVYASNIDANELLTRLRGSIAIDVIDIDPYGSPVSFLETALLTLRNGGLLMITATDIAVLYGVYPKTCLRRYHSLSQRTPFSIEVALRILIGYILRQAAKLDKYIEIVLSYYHQLYLRVCVELYKGATKADKQLTEKMGYIVYCPNCGRREVYREYPYTPDAHCRKCKLKAILLGPLWLGELCNEDYCDTMLGTLEDTKYRYWKSEKKILTLLKEENRMPPYYYSVTEIAKLMKTEEPSPLKLRELLMNNGYKATLTHFDSKGVKTIASMYEIVEVLKHGT